MYPTYLKGVAVLLGALVVCVFVGVALNTFAFMPFVMLPVLYWFIWRYRRILRARTTPEAERESREVQAMRRVYLRALIPLVAIPVAIGAVIVLASR